jgi:hypothetical protein
VQQSNGQLQHPFGPSAFRGPRPAHTSNDAASSISAAGVIKLHYKTTKQQKSYVSSLESTVSLHICKFSTVCTSTVITVQYLCVRVSGALCYPKVTGGKVQKAQKNCPDGFSMEKDASGKPMCVMEPQHSSADSKQQQQPQQQ